MILKALCGIIVPLADFYQNGVVATLQVLRDRPLEELEEEVYRYTRKRPLTLILPALYREFESPAMPRIISELKKVNYIDTIVLSLDRANREQFERVRRIMDELPTEVHILWNDGPGMTEIYDTLKEKRLIEVGPGKGRGVWMAMGYTLSLRRSKIIALHDCDIKNYERGLLARLVYPIANPGLSYEFCKGYYARVGEKLYGRVTRLFFGPLVRALRRVVGYDNIYLRYLDSFRYPLAGEFSMTLDLTEAVRIPGDWGLEVGILSEVFLNTTLKRVCQVELMQTYEHKHQEVSRRDPSKGLMRMCIDIAKTLFRMLAQDGVVFPGRFYRVLKVTYLREAYDAVDKYEAVAALNGVHYDRHEEISYVEAFAEALDIATAEFESHPIGVPFLPSWDRVLSAIPDIQDELLETVRRDNEL